MGEGRRSSERLDLLHLGLGAERRRPNSPVACNLLLWRRPWRDVYQSNRGQHRRVAHRFFLRSDSPSTRFPHSSSMLPSRSPPCCPIIPQPWTCQPRGSFLSRTRRMPRPVASRHGGGAPRDRDSRSRRWGRSPILLTLCSTASDAVRGRRQRASAGAAARTRGVADGRSSGKASKVSRSLPSAACAGCPCCLSLPDPSIATPCAPSTLGSASAAGPAASSGSPPPSPPHADTVAAGDPAASWSPAARPLSKPAPARTAAAVPCSASPLPPRSQSPRHGTQEGCQEQPEADSSGPLLGRHEKAPPPRRSLRRAIPC